MPQKSQAQTTPDIPLWGPFLTKDNNPFFGAMGIPGEHMKTFLEYQIELLDFARQRFEKDIEFIERLINTQETTDVVTGLSEFYQEAADDYTKECLKMTDIGSRMTQKVFEQVQDAGEDKKQKPKRRIPAAA
ncbi:phasin family protein [Roseibium sp. RKSG952]|uniref:phasin family protein n=1 Tax=Roseibium sp. RKSG952 TaxID=2529384 RepID=UPI0012BD0F32|nr:phasin family protein [Roseibium sp. RKSG952]MTH95178.1 hypothetical protein [Roseibium sp. RKSG952]